MDKTANTVFSPFPNCGGVCQLAPIERNGEWIGMSCGPCGSRWIPEAITTRLAKGGLSPRQADTILAPFLCNARMMQADGPLPFELKVAITTLQSAYQEQEAKLAKVRELRDEYRAMSDGGERSKYSAMFTRELTAILGDTQ